MKYTYTNEEFSRAKNEILESLKKEVFPVKFPKAFLLGGQPGAGKTTLHTIIKTTTNVGLNIITINGDEYRAYHPKISEIKNNNDNLALSTQYFTNKIVEALIDELSTEKYNLIIEGTLRTINVPENTATILNNKGYLTELYIIAANKELSWNSTISRANEMKELGLIPRTTDKKYHDYICENIGSNLKELQNKNIFSNIKIYDRDKYCLYNAKEDKNICAYIMLDNIINMDIKESNKYTELYRLAKEKNNFSILEQKYTTTLSDKKSNKNLMEFSINSLTDIDIHKNNDMIK